MNFFFKPSFIRIFKKLDNFKQKQIIDAIEALKIVLEQRHSLEGLGFKRLKEDFWEIRASLKDRIVFSFKKDTVTFVLAGSHDDVKKYLRNL